MPLDSDALASAAAQVGAEEIENHKSYQKALGTGLITSGSTLATVVLAASAYLNPEQTVKELIRENVATEALGLSMAATGAANLISRRARTAQEILEEARKRVASQKSERGR